uniref:Uncharacterized protein n=1 Tax=Papio anubis TaxID=9555 RepID=A0A8I5R1R5_PAPAN
MPLCTHNQGPNPPSPVFPVPVDPQVWDTSTPVVARHHLPILIHLKDSTHFPSRPQFSLPLRHRQGIKPIIDRLLQQQILIPTHSPCNTPNLPVKKPSGAYRLVQDLRIINEAVIPTHPVVPNPYTLLSRIPPETSHFTVLDLKDALFSIPLHPDCYFIFAFTWEDPETHVSTQLSWTVLPQGFRDSPHFYGQTLAKDLAQCPFHSSTIIQYVDDLLLCSPSHDISLQDTATLLNFLGRLGYRITKQKAQLCLPKVIYLGIELTPVSKSLTTDRLSLIQSLTPPSNGDEILSFLGLVGFFRHWIPNFGVLAKPLYQAAKESPTEPLSDPKLIATHFTRLKSCLLSAPTLSLPNHLYPFYLFADERHKIATGLLAQPKGTTFRPVAYLSKQLDTTVQGWQPCLRALAAAAELTKEALKLTLGGPLTVHSTHRLQDLITHKCISHLTPSRIQLFHVLFLENPDIKIATCSSLNPATLLPTPNTSHTPEHSCPEIIQLALPTHLHLRDQPLPDPQLTFFVDGSSFVDPHGNRHAGYAVVTNTQVIEAKPLPLGTTSQKAELTALTRALHLSEGKTVNIYTDSKYAYMIAHTHSVLWQERGFFTTKGTPIINGKHIQRLLEALTSPKEVAIVHCRGYQKPTNPIAQGNNLADTTAKSIALSTEKPQSLCFLTPQYTPSYSSEEKNKLLQNPHATITPDQWIFIHNRVVLPEAQTQHILRDIHNSLHIGHQALYNFLNPIIECPSLLSHLKKISQQCLICLKANAQGGIRNAHPSHQLRGHQPREDWQIDFTHMPRHKKLRFLLTLVDTFSGWIEPYPTTGESASIVASILIEQIIPRFGLPRSIQSDNGPAFISRVIQLVTDSLNITWKLHIPYHPQSSGKVERANGLIKQQLTKLSIETHQSWVTLLPLALTRLRATPRGPTGLSPFELVYGRPLALQELPSLPTPLAPYLPYLSLLRQLLREHAERSLPHPTQGNSEAPSALSPGDQVLLKDLHAKGLIPKWKGPYTVILTTSTAAKLLGHSSWVHLTQLKRAPPPQTQWQSTELSPTRLRITRLNTN